MDVKDENTKEERWGLFYQMGEAVHGMALGGLGTGSLELSTDGSFVCSSLQNNWIREIENLPTDSFLAISAAANAKAEI